MKDVALVKTISIAGSVAIVVTMLCTDGATATAAATVLLASLTGLGGYAAAKVSR